jgi:hypothetical protein
MITGIVMFGIFNGAVISVMAQTAVEAVNLIGPSDGRLADSRLCTLSGSFEEYLRAHGLRDKTTFAQSLQECFELLVNRKVRRPEGVRAERYRVTPRLRDEIYLPETFR